MALVMAVALVAHTLAFDPEPTPTEAVPDTGTETSSVEDVTPAPVLSPHAYLYAQYPSLAPKLACMITLESGWDPGAKGAGGLYVGLAQFDPPTWASTPQGAMGLSRTDPYASIDAMAWGTQHLGWGRWPRSSRMC